MIELHKWYFRSFSQLTVTTTSYSTGLIYPLAFLDWQNFGFLNFCTCLLIFAILILVTGYLLVLFDGLISDKIAKYIVLPRIKKLALVEYHREWQLVDR